MAVDTVTEEQPIIKWSVARAKGLTYYFTGVPCRNGHITVRDVSDRCCHACKCIKAAAWKKRNAEKHAAINKKWAIENPESPRRTVLRARSRDPKMYWAVSTFQNARLRALKKGLPFSVTRQELYDLAGTHCPVFGTEFNFVGNGRIVPTSPSLDRVNPALGYVRGNVVVISMLANAIKQNATAAQIARVAEWLKLLEDE